MTNKPLLMGAVLAMLLASPSPTFADAAPFSSDVDLDTLLKQGELVLTESNNDGTLKRVTAISVVRASPQAVWDRLVAYEAYQSWMPKVGAVVVQKREGPLAEIQWEVEVPGPNYVYTMRSTEDQASWMIRQEQIAGSLAGSHWSWQLIPRGDKTLVFRTAFTNVTDESWIAKQLDDQSHTLSFSVNVSSCLLEIKALRRAAEGKK